MNSEKMYYSKLRSLLKRSPSNLFKGLVFVSYGGFGNSVVLKDLVEIHGGSIQSFVDEECTHFLLPFYGTQGSKRVSEVIQKKKLKLVPLFWVLDSIEKQELLDHDCDNSEYNYDHEEVLRQQKRKRTRIVFGPPIKKRKGENCDVLFIYPSKRNLTFEDELEPLTLSEDQKITFQIQKPPKVDPRMRCGKSVFFDGRNKKYFHVLLHLSEFNIKSPLEKVNEFDEVEGEEDDEDLDDKEKYFVEKRQYFVMQLVRGFTRGETTLFERWGRAGDLSYSNSTNFKRIQDADAAFQRKYELLTNNNWSSSFEDHKLFRGYYFPVKFNYNFTLPNTQNIWT